MLTLLLGGARSGKSALAVELGRRHDGPVTFVATSEPFDGDLAARIARHRAERPAWPTVEEPLDLAARARRRSTATALVIVDCLTLWVSNLMHRGDTDADDRGAVRRGAAVRRRPRRRRPSSSATRSASASTPRRRSGCATATCSGGSTSSGRPSPTRTLLLVAGRAAAARRSVGRARMTGSVSCVCTTCSSTCPAPTTPPAAAVHERAAEILRPSGALAWLDELAAWIAGWHRTDPATRRPARSG